MPTTDIVNLEDLDSYIALSIQKVNDGVARARAAGIQAELPKALDFEMVVIAPGGWQAYEAQSIQDDSGTDNSETIEDSTVQESGNTTEKQTGYQIEKRTGTTVVAQSGSEERVSRGEEHHTQNTDETTDTYEA